MAMRRFNAAIKSRYGRPPSAMRRDAGSGGAAGASLTLALQFRPPYDWAAMIAYLAARAIPGVELVREDVYLRTVAIGGHRGWLSVAPEPSGAALRATISSSLAGALMGVVAAGAFMASLLASGLSSSVVGTMAGQTIMQDFVKFRIPLWVR